jgi:hypothetical protein
MVRVTGPVVAVKLAGIILARRYPQLALLEEFHANRYHVTKT